jgi:ankyrin repeat protein
MPIQSLPNNPSLENLRKQAKSFRKSVIRNDPDALARVREFHPHGDEIAENFSLAAAQLVIARSHGFSSWSRLKQHLEVLELSFFPPEPKTENESEPLTDRFIRLACLNYSQFDHKERHVKARELLAQHPTIAAENIYAAATVGDVQAVRNALNADPSLAAARGGPYNWEPLLYAAYSRLNSTATGHSTLEVARLLLDRAADPNAGFLWDGHYLFTALTGAFGEGEAGPVNQPQHQYCYELARLLLEAGADPNDGQTLYNRMFTGGTKHLELLFEFGLGNGGNGVWFRRFGHQIGTPSEMLQQQMGWAAKYNQMERMQVLVEHGVDVNGIDSRLQRTAYELAVLNGNKEIAEYLLEHGATPGQLNDADAFAAACLTANEKQARSLLAKDPALLERLRPDRVELLQLAAERDQRDAIRLMAELGFDLNELKRTTALHHAASAGHLEMAKLLIELGADPLIRDTEFNARPIGWARYGEQSEVAEFLQQFEPE